MAKSKPIGVRFDLEILKELYEKLKLETPQQVLNYLMTNSYIHFQSKVGTIKENTEIPKKEITESEYGFKVEKWFSIDNYTKHPKKDRPISLVDRLTWENEKSFSDSLIRTNWEQFQKDNS